MDDKDEKNFQKPDITIKLIGFDNGKITDEEREDIKKTKKLFDAASLDLVIGYIIKLLMNDNEKLKEEMERKQKKKFKKLKKRIIHQDFSIFYYLNSFIVLCSDHSYI